MRKTAAVVLFHNMNKNPRPALFWFAVLNAVATFLLIGLGGLVTSHEAGMSVPDWPTSYEIGRAHV